MWSCKDTNFRMLDGQVKDQGGAGNDEEYGHNSKSISWDSNLKVDDTRVRIYRCSDGSGGSNPPNSSSLNVVCTVSRDNPADSSYGNGFGQTEWTRIWADKVFSRPITSPTLGLDMQWSSSVSAEIVLSTNRVDDTNFIDPLLKEAKEYWRNRAAMRDSLPVRRNDLVALGSPPRREQHWKTTPYERKSTAVIEGKKSYPSNTQGRQQFKNVKIRRDGGQRFLKIKGSAGAKLSDEASFQKSSGSHKDLTIQYSRTTGMDAKGVTETRKIILSSNTEPSDSEERRRQRKMRFNEKNRIGGSNPRTVQHRLPTNRRLTLWKN